MSFSTDKRSKYMDVALESLRRHAELVAQHFDGDDQERLMDEILKMGEQYSLLDLRHQRVTDCFNEIENAIKERSKTNENDQEEEDDVEINVRAMYKAKMEQKCSKNVDPKKLETYKILKNRIDELLAQGSSKQNGDEDSMIVDAEVNTIDPITKKEMSDPVRIKQCGHAFERNSIMCLMKNSKIGIKCPVPGCVLQYRICARDLEDHHELRLLLQRRA